MAETKTEKPAKPEARHVFVVNSEPRLYQLMTVHTGPNDKTSAPLVFAPGLNWVDEAKLDACAIEGQGALDSFRGKVYATDPTKLPDMIAIDLASKTANRQALGEWRKIERRDDVRAAIDARLANKRAA